MEQDDDTGRNEPSFGRDDALEGSHAQSSGFTDFDELFAEIDKSVADAFSAPATPAHDESWVDELTATPEIGDGSLHTASTQTIPPAQPAFDFDNVDDVVTPGRAHAQAEPQFETSNGEEAMSRGVLMAGGALAALGILLGAVGVVVGLRAAGKVEELQQGIDALQSKLATLQVSGDPRVGQLQAEQSGITSRLDEMNARLDALPSKGDEGQLNELTKRLDALEHKSSRAVVVATPSRSSSHKTTTVTTARPAATSSGEWTVILVSFTLHSQADNERSRIQRLGYPADVIKTDVDGKPWYRVRILGYKSHEAAKAAIPAIEKKVGITGIWAAHR